MSNNVYVTKFGIIQGIDPSIVAFVNSAIDNATKNLLTQSGVSTVGAVAQYALNKVVTSTPYTLPTTLGVNGETLIVSGSSLVYGSAVTTDFIPTLTVTTLAQGTSSLSKNYIFPTAAPSIDNTRYALSALNIGAISPGTINVLQLSTFSFLVSAVTPLDSYTISFSIGQGLYTVLEFQDVIIFNIRRISQNFPNVTYNFNLSFNGVVFLGSIQPLVSNFVSFSIAPYAPLNLGNALLGGLSSGSTTFVVGSAPFPLPPPTYTPAPPPTYDLTWSPMNLPQELISSTTGSSSILCNEVGDISIRGSINMGLSNLNEVGSINTTANTLNLTTPTTQFNNGNSISEILVDGVSRIYMNNANTFIRDQNNQDRIQIYDTGYTALRSIAGGGTKFVADINGQISISSNNNAVFYSDPSSNNTRIFSPNGTSELSVENTNGIKINNSYYLPTVAGTAGQLLTSNGPTSSWSNQNFGIFTQTTDTTIFNTALESTLLGSGVGSLSTPINYFSSGVSFNYKCGGIFRTSGGGQSLRFRFRVATLLFDSGLINLPNINSLRSWNLDIIFTYTTGTTMITNSQFNYDTGTTTFARQQTVITFDPSIINVLNFTVQWGAANINNTITSNYGVISRLM